MKKRYIVGVTGASGTQLSLCLIENLVHNGFFVDVIMTKDAVLTANYEFATSFKAAKDVIAMLPKSVQEKTTLQSNNFLGASPASGGYLVEGMIIAPCSMASLAAISVGLCDNLLRRAADVTLKEKRPLVIVPRESPFSEIHLENMLKLARMGVAIVPPVAAWYLKPKTIGDVESYIVGKVLDVLRIKHDLYERWFQP
jgi:4-hydroxy-3-polyprenylbenzoate decarboxylase